MCLDFHPEVGPLISSLFICFIISTFQHPHMLVVGLYDGNIAVYNLQKNVGVPNYQSDAKNGKHRDIVWQVGSIGVWTSYWQGLNLKLFEISLISAYSVDLGENRNLLSGNETKFSVICHN